MSKVVWSIVIVTVWVFSSFAQVESDLDLEAFIENLFSLQEIDVDYTDFYEELLSLSQSPLNLNESSFEELKNTYLLSDNQINNLLLYIQDHGKLITLYELQVIEGFDPVTIQGLIPFVTVDSKEASRDARPLLERIRSAANHYLLVRHERILELKRGYMDPQDSSQSFYQGSPDKLFFRYRLARSGDFSFGLTAEKDPGETISFDKASNKNGLDFWSGHIMLENQGRIRKVILGDYQLQLGQGLIFNAGFNIGKGAETIKSIQRASVGIRPYTSVLESGFLRGLANTIVINEKFRLTSFYSRLKQDARLSEAENGLFFSSLQTSGLHRTTSEIINKNTVIEQIAGLDLNFQPNHRFRLGATLARQSFDIPISESSTPYRWFELSGRKNLNSAVYGNFLWRGFSIFMEGAISSSGGLGTILGFSKDLSPRISLSMLIRNYDKDFHSIAGRSFAEGSRNINEQGVYWGIKYVFNRKFFINAYYDSYRFPWRRFQVASPSDGSDYLIRVNYNPKINVNFFVQVRSETKDRNIQASDERNSAIRPGQRNQYLFNLTFNPNSNLRLKSRIQWSNYSLNNARTSGIAFIQDAAVQIKKWKFAGRIAFFDTQSIENRQFAYERDVLYAFSIPAYGGRGVRNYLLVQYATDWKLDFWIRLARTTFYDRTEIGTGLETIVGDTRTELKFQVRYKLK